MRIVRLPSWGVTTRVRTAISARALVGLGLLWLTVFFVLPVGFLLIESLNFGDGSLFEHYERALSTVYLYGLGRTLAYAFVTTIICLVLGYTIAYYIAFRSNRPILLLSLVLLPLWIAIIIRYFGVNLFFLPTGPVQEIFGTDFGVLYSTPGVIIGLVSALLPFAILPMYNSLRSIDDELLDASHILGASPFETFRTIMLPLSLSGIVAATLFVFILAAGSFLAPDILGGPGDAMMANYIEDATTYSIELSAAFSVIFTAALLLLVGLFNHVANISEVLGEL
ncbi:ABC transporter permease [Halostagnicola bangensis]